MKFPPISNYNSQVNTFNLWLFLVILFLPVVMIYAQQQVMPWLKPIDPDNRRSELISIKALANVNVSDGLTYNTTTVFHDAQRAVFHRVYPDKTVGMGIDGQYFWQFDGITEHEATEFVRTFVLGHQFHAQLLFFDKLFPDYKITPDITFAGQACSVAINKSSDSTNALYYTEDGMPIGFMITLDNGLIITYEYSNWKMTGGFYIPYNVNIDDGQRKFEYEFTEVAWNSGRSDEYKAPYESLTDTQKLMRQHRYIMDGHFFGESAQMKSQQSENMSMLNKGVIYKVQGNQPEGMIDKILANRNYTLYDDLVPPEITISEDGTLGWVIAQLHAQGKLYETNDKPEEKIDFTCAWVELYKKEGETWKLKGITSTFK